MNPLCLWWWKLGFDPTPPSWGQERWAQSLQVPIVGPPAHAPFACRWDSDTSDHRRRDVSYTRGCHFLSTLASALYEPYCTWKEFKSKWLWCPMGMLSTPLRRLRTTHKQSCARSILIEWTQRSKPRMRTDTGTSGGTFGHSVRRSYGRRRGRLGAQAHDSGGFSHMTSAVSVQMASFWRERKSRPAMLGWWVHTLISFTTRLGWTAPSSS